MEEPLTGVEDVVVDPVVETGATTLPLPSNCNRPKKKNGLSASLEEPVVPVVPVPVVDVRFSMPVPAPTNA